MVEKEKQKLSKVKSVCATCGEIIKRGRGIQ